MTPVRIRAATPADGAALLELELALDRETSFMLISRGERRETAEDVGAQLERVAAAENSTVLLAEDRARLLGYVEAEGGRYRRNRHCAHVVIGVRAAASGRGVGTALLDELSAWAARHGVERLELTVVAHNERAIALYRRCGYDVEGTRRAAVRLEGSYVDELFMARLARR